VRPLDAKDGRFGDAVLGEYIARSGVDRKRADDEGHREGGVLQPDVACTDLATSPAGASMQGIRSTPIGGRPLPGFG
jgi:hypothetical protein